MCVCVCVQRTHVFQNLSYFSPSKEKRAEINQAIATQKPFEATLINYKKNGEIYECHIRSFPIFNKKGELTHFIALEKAA